jgi:hypothetical protein
MLADFFSGLEDSDGTPLRLAFASPWEDPVCPSQVHGAFKVASQRAGGRRITWKDLSDAFLSLNTRGVKGSKPAAVIVRNTSGFPLASVGCPDDEAASESGSGVHLARGLGWAEAELVPEPQVGNAKKANLANLKATQSKATSVC